LNYRWHASAFASVEDMLDPDRNALYAAGYLARHHARTGDWAAAAAAYHSATPEHAERYRARYEETVADLGGAPPMRSETPTAPRGNGFRLLVAGAAGRNGSLVPGTSPGSRLIGGP
jgi:soluble lytic murein transglycosylase-like protein